MHPSIAESRMAVEATNLKGVEAAASRRGVAAPGVWLDTELLGDVGDHSPWGVLDLSEEGAQESQGANLDSEPEHRGISTAPAGPLEIIAVEVEEPIQLLDSGFTAESASSAGLYLGEKGDWHSWLPACRWG